VVYNTKISDNNAESGKVPRMLAALLTLLLKKNGCMSAYSLLDAISFDISFIEIRQEIKLVKVRAFWNY
jgi:hypothetical protein